MLYTNNNQYTKHFNCGSHQLCTILKVDVYKRQTLLEKMQLDYNKLRQANITRELTELSAFFLQ